TPGESQRRVEAANLARAQGRFDEAQALILEFLPGSQEGAEVGFGREGVATLGIDEIAAGAYARGVTLLGAASNVEGPIGIVHVPNLRIEAPVGLELARGRVEIASCRGARRSSVGTDRPGARQTRRRATAREDTAGRASGSRPRTGDAVAALGGG